MGCSFGARSQTEHAMSTPHKSSRRRRFKKQNDKVGEDGDLNIVTKEGGEDWEEMSKAIKATILRSALVTRTPATEASPKREGRPCYPVGEIHQHTTAC